MSDGAERRFFGGLLVAAGVLLATLSGLCSLACVVAVLDAALKGRTTPNNLLFQAVIVSAFGGLPFAAGIAVILAGRAVMKKGSVQPPG